MLLIVDIILGIITLGGLLKAGEKLEEKINHNPNASDEEREQLHQEHVNRTYQSVDLLGNVVHKPVRKKKNR